MAKRASICVHLVLQLALLAECCSFTCNAQKPDDITAAEVRTIDLYGGDADDMEPLVPLLMAPNGMEELNSMGGSAKLGEAGEEGKEVWKKPEHKMDLIRFFHGRYYETQYDKINERLVREVDTRNLDQNFALLTDWLERERNKSVTLFNRASVEALQQLIDLYNLKGKMSCNRDAYTILFKNDQATRGRAHKPPNSLQPPRRVDALVYQLFLDHAIECFNEYPRNYIKVRETMNQDVKRMVETFLDLIIGDPLAVSTEVRTLSDKRIAPLLYNYLRVNAIDDRLAQYLGKVVNERNGKLHVDDKKLVKLVEKYIVQPCEDYLQAMGPDVFLPTRFDLRMLLHEDRYQSDSRLINDFLHSYLHFNLCEKLIKRDAPYLIQNVVEHIHSIVK